MVRKIPLIAIALFINTNLLLARPNFVLPIKGEQGVDYFILYKDANKVVGQMHDYNCGRNTFHGHKGTQFVTLNYKAIDSGINVHAVADGIVVEYADGLYDRNKHGSNDGYGNYVTIRHGNYLVTYANLKKQSIKVGLWDSVRQDQVIAQVGSSGDSYKPGLSLYITDKSRKKYYDPFRGKCSSTKKSFWVEQIEYDTSLRAMNLIFVPYKPSTQQMMDSLKEEFQARDTFYIGRDSLITFYATMLGLNVNDTIVAKWYNNQDELVSDFTLPWQHAAYESYAWFYLNAARIKRPGGYKIKVYVNKKLLLETPFYALYNDIPMNNPQKKKD